jgi:hypothetical protein
MWYYLLFGGITEVLGFIYKDSWKFGFELFNNLFISFEATFYSIFFYDRLFKRKYNWIILICYLVWQSSFWIHTLSIEEFVMNDAFYGINCLIYTSLSLFMYKSMLVGQEHQRLINSPDFWVNTGIFVCAAGGCLFFLLLDRVQSENIKVLVVLWMSFYSMLNLIRYSFIGLGLRKVYINERR